MQMKQRQLLALCGREDRRDAAQGLGAHRGQLGVRVGLGLDEAVQDAEDLVALRPAQVEAPKPSHGPPLLSPGPGQWGCGAARAVPWRLSRAPVPERSGGSSGGAAPSASTGLCNMLKIWSGPRPTRT